MNTETYESIQGQEKVLELSEFLTRCSQIPQGFTKPLPESLHARQLIMLTVLTKWYQPGTREHKLYREIYLIIQLGKLGKSETNDREAIQITKEWLDKHKRKKWEPIPLLKEPINTISLFGSPGMGKTQFWDHVMHKCFKQVVLQNNRLELCYIIINCSAFNSIKALCQSIFREFDQALINYYHTHGIEYTHPYLLEFDKPTYTAEKMLPYIANIAHHHSLGVLVIDEINHLTDGNKDFDHIVNFFKNLSRSIGLPIVLSGTQDALDKLAVNLQAARRLCTTIEWRFYSKKSKLWERFIESLWEFQITESASLLTDDIKSAYHKESGGIIDACLKIHVKCQMEAIELNKKVDGSFIKAVTEKYFPALKKIVIGIHSNDPYLIKRYKDIQVGFPTLVNSLNEKLDFTKVTQKIAGMNLSNTQVGILLDILKTQYPEISEERAKGFIAAAAKTDINPEGEEPKTANNTKKETKSPKAQVTGILPNASSSDTDEVEKQIREKGLSGDLDESLINQ
jgi:hypothetical protein